MKYSLIPQPRTSPPRYMIADGDTIIARGLLRSTARRIIAALLLSDLHPEQHQLQLKLLSDSGI